MKKRIFNILLAMILCVVMVTPAYAEAYMPRVVDNAGFLTDKEQSELQEKLDEISEKYQVDVVVVTTDTLDGKTPQAYADDFYDYNGYGFGEEYDGVLLLVTADRDWCISTTGYGITAFTDSGIDYISDKFLPYLKDDNYAEAFSTYAELCDDFLNQAQTDKPYDGDNMPKEPFNVLSKLAVAMGIGIAVSLIVTGSMKGQLKSVRFQAAAGDYVKANSMNITESRDMFLYNTITRTEISKSEDSSGGSSTHTSSSGTTHGGASGKF